MKRLRIFSKTAAAAALAVILCCFGSCTAQNSEYSGFAMGSLLTAKIYDNSERAQEIFNGVSDKISETDSLLSMTSSDSDIGKINDRGSSKVSYYTMKLLMDAVAICNICERTLDISIGSLSELWGFSSDDPKKPQENEISTALETVGIDKVLIDEASQTVSVADGQKLDLGAVGKGAALDEAYYTVSQYLAPAVITLGGTVMLYGENPDHGTWSVGIRNPFEGENNYFAVLKLKTDNSRKALFISTSGSYEKSFDYEGKSYHHILSPKTGYPVETQLVSVTVISESGLTSDALSTACFINGLNDTTLRWLSSFGADAVFVFEDGGCYATNSDEGGFLLTAESGFKEIAYESEN